MATTLKDLRKREEIQKGLNLGTPITDPSKLVPDSVPRFELNPKKDEGISDLVIRKETQNLEDVRTPRSEKDLDLRQAAYLISQAEGLDAYEKAQLEQKMGITDRENFRLQQEEQAKAQQRAQLLGQIGASPQLSGQMSAEQMGITSPTDIDWGQVFMRTISDPQFVRDIAMGAVGGGLVVGTAGAAVGAIPGALIGAGVGIYSSVMRNIQAQKSDNLSAQRDVLERGQTNINQLISLMNMDPDNSYLYVQAMNEQLGVISKSYSQLKYDTSTDLNLALGLDGTKELAKYEMFYSAGGAYDYLTTRAQVALASPNMETGMRGLIMSQGGISTENE